MKKVVLDCSMTMAWLFEDEATEFSDQVLREITRQKLKAVAPALWELEVTNVLLCKIRRSHLSLAQAADFLSKLGKIGVEIIAPHPTETFEIIFPLAHEEKLTSYDASYLHLALTGRFPLASLDAQLCSAAKKVGVVIF